MLCKENLGIRGPSNIVFNKSNCHDGLPKENLGIRSPHNIIFNEKIDTNGLHRLNNCLA